MEVTEILSVEKFPDFGYELRTEMWKSYDGDEPSEMIAAYNATGIYIGNKKMAEFLCRKKRIFPEEATPGDGICSVGFCASKQKWYGYSHRAIFGFKVGDVVEEGDATASSGWTAEYLLTHPEDDLSLPVGFTAKTLDDARLMAVAFAESVG